MRSLTLALLIFGFSSTSSAIIDTNYDVFGHPFRNFTSDRPDRDAAYAALENEKEKYRCIPPIDLAGLPLFSYLEITPTRLPEGIENFKLRISICDSNQRCQSARRVEFPAASLGQIVSQAWIIEYGCYVKPTNVIEGVQLELIQVRAWHQRDSSVDVLYLPLNDLPKGPKVVSTRTKKAEFKIELKTN